MLGKLCARELKIIWRPPWKSLKGETIDATSRCLTCNDLLCPECAEHRHRSTTLTINHQVVSLVEVNAGKYHDEIRSKQQIPCFEHKGEDLKFFCETCDVPVCLDCIVLSHQNHRCVTPSDARKQMEENFKLLLNSLDQKLKIFTNGAECVVSSLDKFERGVKDVKQNLENQSNAIIKNIMDSRKRVEEEFDQFVESERNTLQQKEKAIQSEKKLFDETLLFCTNIFRCGSDIEILSMKTEMKERLSKLESSNITETCKVEKIVTPVIKFCNSKRCFELFTKMDEDITTKAKERAKFVAPQQSETADNVTKELQALSEEVQKTFSAKDEDEPKNPNYTSVTWVDDDTIAVVDQRNQKLKRISTKGNVETVTVAECMTVSSFKDGLACKSARGILYFFDKSLNLKNTVSEVSTLLTCTSQSLEICWISGLEKIFILRDGDCKEINIHDPNTTSNLSEPKFGHVLQNGMFAVSDWDKKCVCLISRTGLIERRKNFGTDSSPGSISSDSALNIYVCDYRKSLVTVFVISGDTLCTIYIGSVAPNPRSISINQDGRTLIANGKTFVQHKLIY
ncbi:uncharacterized protein LOC144620934 isoform X2 [Crassostrea virginica]